jgi:hypothetical protein
VSPLSERARLVGSSSEETSSFDEILSVDEESLSSLLSLPLARHFFDAAVDSSTSSSSQ